MGNKSKLQGTGNCQEASDVKLEGKQQKCPLNWSCSADEEIQSKSLSLLKPHKTLAASGWDCIISIIITINIYPSPKRKKKKKEIYSLTKIKPKPIVLLLSTQSVSGQAEALVVVDGLHEAGAEDLLAAVLGQVQQVVAGVGHGQVLLPAGRRLDDDAQAGHAVDGNAVAARQEHCQTHKEGWAGEGPPTRAAPTGEVQPHPPGGAETLTGLHAGPGWLPGELQHSKASARHEHWSLSFQQSQNLSGWHWRDLGGSQGQPPAQAGLPSYPGQKEKKHHRGNPQLWLADAVTHAGSPNSIQWSSAATPTRVFQFQEMLHHCKILTEKFLLLFQGKCMEGLPEHSHSWMCGSVVSLIDSALLKTKIPHSHLALESKD